MQPLLLRVLVLQALFFLFLQTSSWVLKSTPLKQKSATVFPARTAVRAAFPAVMHTQKLLLKTPKLPQTFAVPAVQKPPKQSARSLELKQKLQNPLPHLYIAAATAISRFIRRYIKVLTPVLLQKCSMAAKALAFMAALDAATAQPYVPTMRSALLTALQKLIRENVLAADFA